MEVKALHGEILLSRYMDILKDPVAYTSTAKCFSAGKSHKEWCKIERIVWSFINLSVT